MAKAIEIKEGDRFGRWTIIKQAPEHRQPNGKLVRMFSCLCDCGNKADVTLLTLRNGRSVSCGCYMKEVNGKRLSETFTTHGNTPRGENEYKSLFFVWNTIKQRCYNEKVKKYSNYGAKGIKVCDEWLNDFAAFRDWSVANGYYKQSKDILYKEKLSIDRKDVTKDYCPDNCQWITVSQNSLRRHHPEIKF